MLFVANVAGYDVPSDDGAPNDLRQAMAVYGEITKLQCFARTPILLLLNKMDMFKEKIQRRAMCEFF